jgi:hypothetical protein
VNRGPGRVGRMIAAAFRDHPENSYTTTELAALVYGIEPYEAEKKHRVAVIRAAKPLEQQPSRFALGLEFFVVAEEYPSFGRNLSRLSSMLCFVFLHLPFSLPYYLGEAARFG